MRSSRVMLSGVLALSLLAVSPRAGVAKCGDNPGDEQAVIAAQSQVASQCDCAGSTNHGQFVKCAKGVANSDQALPKNCKSAVVKCAAHSACGKQGAVTCCITKKGKTKCKISTAAKCTSKGGTTGGVGGMHTSCCSNTHPLSENSCMASPSGAFLDARPAGF